MDRVCPLLGLAGDRRSVIDGVDSAHRCHAEPVPLPLTRHEQAQLCLTRSHTRCERYVRYVSAVPGGIPGRIPVADGLVSTRMVLTPQPAWRGIAGRARRAPRGPLAVIALAVVGVTFGGVAIVSGLVDLGTAVAAPTPTAAPSTPVPSPTTSPPAQPSPTRRPTPTATPQATVSPTPAATIAATPVATTTPTPAPAITTYVVQAGDTLAAIAQEVGSTVAALQAANGIADPNEIVIGQVLVIP